jgi:hypothetical protein
MNSRKVVTTECHITTSGSYVTDVKCFPFGGSVGLKRIEIKL